MPSIDDFPSEWIDNASKVISINNDKNVWDSTNVDSEDAQETEDSGTEWEIWKENKINGIAGFYDDYKEI